MQTVSAFLFLSKILLSAAAIFSFAPGYRTTYVHAAQVSVSSVSELASALDTAQNNSEDDIILISAGTYPVQSTLTYVSNENHSITVQADSGPVVLKGEGNRVFFARTYSTSGHIILKGITIKDGYVPEESNGAGLFINIASGDLLIESCRIVDNFAAAFYSSNSGGGAYITAGIGANVTIRNTVFAGNTAKGHGGGLYLNLTDGTLYFVNNTITNNHNKTSTVEQGGGMYLSLYYDSSRAYLFNNIFWNNTYAHGEGDLFIKNNIYNSESAAAVFLRNNNYHAADVSLQNNLTITASTNHAPQLTEDFHLAGNSPSIDAGSGGVSGLPATDFEGQPRSLDGDCSGDAQPDQGSDEYYSPPLLSTMHLTGITSSSVSSGGNITSAGGHPVLARGVCWSKSTMPDLSDDCSAEGAGTGLFTSTLNGLDNSTTYFLRAYAQNCEGVSYGNQLSFRTSERPTISTAEVTNINAPHARSGGNISGEGDSPVTARGVC